jgi:hypothetical protein
MQIENPNHKLLGAGRSGKVYLVKTPDGEIARKVFYEDKLANLVHYVFGGVPNPYVWNEDAINCAYYRRKILRKLVYFWFDSKLKIADAFQRGWNEEFKAYQLDTEFIHGRPVALHQPLAKHQGQELHELVHSIMIPLQKHLIHSGFDGLVWQAGKGNPVALSNFLLADSSTDKNTFVCIDVESGIPALFPLNIWTLFSFYLPKSFKYGHAMFDDVDIPKLKNYLDTYKNSIEEKIGDSEYAELLKYIDYLEYHQEKWKSMKRITKSIQYHLHKGEITEEEANWFLQYPIFWYIRELGKILYLFLKALFVKIPTKIFNSLKRIPYKTFFVRFGKFLISQRYRLKIAKDYVREKIIHWQNRKQLNAEETNNLIHALDQENASDYLNDFAVHLGMKAFFPFVELSMAPLLYSLGIINEAIVAFWLVMGGSIYRAIYTVFRMFQAAAAGQEVPWVAFFVGFIPTFGLLAYPCQIVYSAMVRKGKVAQFILYDFFSKLGRKIPIWGGEDTLTEHFFNNLADKIVHCVKESR